MRFQDRSSVSTNTMFGGATAAAAAGRVAASVTWAPATAATKAAVAPAVHNSNLRVRVMTLIVVDACMVRVEAMLGLCQCAPPIPRRSGIR